MKIKTDSSGRLLCPECGAGLYAALEGWYSCIPALTDPDQPYGLDCWDTGEAAVIEVDLHSLHCSSCNFWVSANEFDKMGVQND